MNFPETIIEKAKDAKTPEELFTLAKENNIELSAKEAGAYFARLHKIGEVSDDELDSVSGGGCGSEGALSTSKTVTVSGRRLGWNCPVCHNDCWEESYKTTVNTKWWYCCVCAKKNPSDVPYVSQPGRRSSFPSVSVSVDI